MILRGVTGDIPFSSRINRCSRRRPRFGFSEFNVSQRGRRWAAQKHIGNTVYGLAKAANDKTTSADS